MRRSQPSEGRENRVVKVRGSSRDQREQEAVSVAGRLLCWKAAEAAEFGVTVSTVESQGMALRCACSLPVRHARICLHRVCVRV